MKKFVKIWGFPRHFRISSKFVEISFFVELCENVLFRKIYEKRTFCQNWWKKLFQQPVVIVGWRRCFTGSSTGCAGNACTDVRARLANRCHHGVGQLARRELVDLSQRYVGTCEQIMLRTKKYSTFTLFVIHQGCGVGSEEDIYTFDIWSESMMKIWSICTNANFFLHTRTFWGISRSSYSFWKTW